jgi:hypothetical protein
MKKTINISWYKSLDINICWGWVFTISTRRFACSSKAVTSTIRPSLGHCIISTRAAKMRYDVWMRREKNVMLEKTNGLLCWTSLEGACKL